MVVLGVGTGVGEGDATTGATLDATMPPVGQPEVIVAPLEFVAVPMTATTVPCASVPLATFVGNDVDVAGVTEISPQPFAASK
jgi:hypothetical protein